MQLAVYATGREDKMICKAEELDRVTSRAIMFVPNRAVNEYLHCFRFFGNELEATDFSVHGKFRLPDGLNFESEVLVNASTFSAALKNMSGDVDIQPTEKTLDIKSTTSSLSLPLASHKYAECPDLPGEFTEDTRLLKAMNAVYPYVIKPGAGAQLKSSEGVILHKNNVIGFHNNAMVYATADNEIDEGVIIARDIVKKLPDAHKCGFAPGKSRVFFRFDDCILSSTLINSQIPKYEPIINTKFECIARIMTEDLRAAISNIFVMSEEQKFAKAEFKVSGETVEVHTQSKAGVFDTNLKASVTGECRFLMNVNFIKMLLPNIKSETVRIGYKSPSDAIGFTGFIEKDEKKENKLSAFIAQVTKEFGE